MMTQRQRGAWATMTSAAARNLRGYVRTWLRQISDEYDRVGLLDRLYDRTAAAA